MFYDKFERLCELRKTTPSAVCQAVGLSRTTSAYWKRSNGVPKREALEKIAEYLGVSVDYLLERDEKNAPDDAARSVIIEKVKSLPDSQLDRLLGYLEGLAEE